MKDASVSISTSFGSACAAIGDKSPSLADRPLAWWTTASASSKYGDRDPELYATTKTAKHLRADRR
jgi:hypothetical protein